MRDRAGGEEAADRPGWAPTARYRGRRCEKLALFARGKARIEEADVEAAVGDAAEMALDRIVLAAASGRAADAVAECDRSVAGGDSAQSVIAALQRHYVRLHRLRSGYDAGRSLEDAMRALKPPPHFRQKAALEQQCRDWSLAGLNTALARIADAAKAARPQQRSGGRAGRETSAGAGRPGKPWGVARRTGPVAWSGSRATTGGRLPPPRCEAIVAGSTRGAAPFPISVWEESILRGCEGSRSDANFQATPPLAARPRTQT